MPIDNDLSRFKPHKFDTAFGKGYCEHIIQNGIDSTGTQALGGSTKQKWTISRTLGKGGFGEVRLEKSDNGKEVRAVKKISKANTLLNSRELQALVELKDYPRHFVKLSGWFEDNDNIYIAMEYLEYGDLMNLISERDIGENDAKAITKQVLDGLKIMHEHKFCHRDLKPQNILVASISPIIVKIGDFGVTKKAIDGVELRTTVGTSGYIAPEVWGFLDTETQAYTSSADIWSLGCLIHFIMTKEVPFTNILELSRYVRRTNTPFPTKKLLEKNVGSAAIDFITSLMKQYPQDRLTAEQALEEPWLTIKESNDIHKRIPSLDPQTNNCSKWLSQGAPQVTVQSYYSITIFIGLNTPGPQGRFIKAIDITQDIPQEYTATGLFKNRKSGVEFRRYDISNNTTAVAQWVHGGNSKLLLKDFGGKFMKSCEKTCTILSQVTPHEDKKTMKSAEKEWVESNRRRHMARENGAENSDNSGREKSSRTTTSKREGVDFVEMAKIFTDGARVARKKLRQMASLAIGFRRGKAMRLLRKGNGTAAK